MFVSWKKNNFKNELELIFDLVMLYLVIISNSVIFVLLSNLSVNFKFSHTTQFSHMIVADQKYD